MLAARVLFTVALDLDIPDISDINNECGRDGDSVLGVLRAVATGMQTVLASVVAEKRKAYKSEDSVRYELLV